MTARPETEWQKLKKLKTRERQHRYLNKSRKMQDSYNRLRRLEKIAISEGRVDFTVEELYEMLFYAYYDARPGKRKTYDVQRVEANLYENLWRLAQEIHDRTYHPSRSEAFVVFKPVVREIFAANFRDRIVHHLLVNICMIWWNRQFVRDSYSCRLGKGTDYGVRRAARHIRQVSQNYTRPAYFVKMDIKGFFMSMDRKKLLEMAIEGVHHQFREFGPLGRLAVFLWREIIMDDPLDGVKIRGKKEDWERLPRDKSLFFQPEGRGIVIGNLTSQLLSNIFLDGLDKFVVYQLGYKHYGRYVDDFFVVVEPQELPKLKEDIERMRVYLRSLALTMHPKKTQYIEVDHGVEYLGHFIRNGHIEMCRRFNGDYYEALLNVTAGIEDVEKVASYMGCCSNYGCLRKQKQIWNAAGQEFVI